MVCQYTKSYVGCLWHFHQFSVIGRLLSVMIKTTLFLLSFFLLSSSWILNQQFKYKVLIGTVDVIVEAICYIRWQHVISITMVIWPSQKYASTLYIKNNWTYCKNYPDFVFLFCFNVLSHEVDESRHIYNLFA